MKGKPEHSQYGWRSIALVMMLVCASVLCTAYTLGSGDSGNSIPVVIESGSGVETASYIIYKDGGTTCLKNGTTGRIEMRSTDAAAVIQQAIDSSNGTIAILGSHTLNTDILVDNETHLSISGQLVSANDTWALSTDANSGDSSITLSSVSGLSEGTMLGVTDDTHTIWDSTGLFQCWGARIADITGNVVTLDRTLGADFNISDNAYAFLAGNIISIVNCSDVIIDGAGEIIISDRPPAYVFAGTMDGTHLYYGEFNCMTGISIGFSEDVTVNGITITGGTSGLAIWNSCCNITLDDVVVGGQNCKCIVCYGYSATYRNDDIQISDSMIGPSLHEDGICLYQYNQNSMVADNNIQDCPRAGVYIKKYSNETLVSSNIITNCGNGTIIGAYLQPTYYVTISDNIMYGNEKNIDTRQFSNGIISGNQLGSTTESVGINLQNCDYLIVSDNMVHHAYGSGFYCSYIYNCSLTGNHIYSCGQGADNTSYGMLLSYGQNNTVAGNIIEQGPETNDVRYGIYLYERFQYNHIYDNDVSDGGEEYNVYNNPIGYSDHTNASYNYYRNNAGYITEKFGETTIPSGQDHVSILHNLAGYPAYGWVTPIGNSTVASNVTSTISWSSGSLYLSFYVSSAVSQDILVRYYVTVSDVYHLIWTG